MIQSFLLLPVERSFRRMRSARYLFLLFPLLAVCSGTWFGMRTFQSRPADAPRVTASLHTTFWTEPVDEEGYVDFVAAINQRESKRVDPAKNCALRLVSIFGPDCLVDSDEDDDYPEEFQKAANSLDEDERFLSMTISDIEWPTVLMEAIHFNPGDKEALKTFKNRFFLQTWAGKNEGALQSAIEAIRLPEFYFPVSDIETIQPSGGIDFRFIVKCGELSELIMYQGHQLISEGKIDQALEHAKLLRELATKLRGGIGGNMLISSDEIHQRAIMLEQSILNSEIATGKQLREYADELRSTRSETVAKRFDQLVRFEMLALVIEEIVREKNRTHSSSRRNSFERGNRRHFYLYRKLNVDLDVAFKHLNLRIDELLAVVDDRSAQEIISDLNNLPIVKRIDPQAIIWAEADYRGKLLGEYYANIARSKIRYLVLQEKLRWTTDNLGIMAFQLKGKRLAGERFANASDLPRELFQGKNLSPLDGRPVVCQRSGNGFRLNYASPTRFHDLGELPFIEIY